jgi:hypothetical protein
MQIFAGDAEPLRLACATVWRCIKDTEMVTNTLTIRGSLHRGSLNRALMKDAARFGSRRHDTH